MIDKKEIKHPEKEFTHGLFSAGVLIDGWLYVSGQGPLDMKTGVGLIGTIEEETALTLKNLELILNNAGVDRDHVVRCTCYLSDMKYFEGFNRIYGEFFTGIRPARTTVQAGLMKGIKVEIDAVARVPAGPIAGT
ncbi:MAG: RidA family protein [Opitutaceae bacterium]|jgi:2-iminobutanoate/2-iminopropanoate deaminase